MKKILLLTSFIAIFSQSEAQISFSNYKDIVVNQGSSRALKLPFSGGLDAPQFSECDLDMDGTLDLVVFDREGYRISTYINEGIANQINYTYAPEYEKLFPKVIDWMLMLDYDGDGKNDIFSAAPGGVRVYKNISNSTTGLSFRLEVNSLLCDYGSITTNLYVEQQDIPAVVDVDDDGDIDILTFSKSIDTSGESIYWYKNMSIDNYNRKDTFIYEVGKECWGRFRESYTDCRANLQYANGICGLGGKSLLTYNEEQIKNHFTQKSADAKHSGSTLLILDANNDGKKDLLVGDISCNTMYMLFNSTNNISPIMTSAIQHYPTARPIDVFVFPAAFLVDVNNDGKKDLIVAPNTPNNSDNFENIHLYVRNDSTTGNNIFTWQSDDFLESEMIDVSEGSSPAFVDYNNDGLLDIVISNTGYYSSSAVYKTGLALYENTGTSTNPKYNLISRDWMGLSSLNINNMSPSFGDLDNDGDLDMVCGSADGLLHFFRNIAATGQSISLQFVPNYFGGLDLGNNTTPFIVDLNNDAKPEIIVGERFFNINLISNTGTPTSPNYVLTTDSLWKIDLGKKLRYPSGRTSVSIASLNPLKNSEKYLLISNGNGMIYIYKNLPSSYTEAIQNFAISDDSLYVSNGNYGGGNVAFHISVADINADFLPEIITGTPQGGLLLFKNESTFSSISKKNYNAQIEIYPNPANNSFQIKSDFKINSLRIININGQTIKTFNINSNQSINTDDLSNGMYFIECIGDEIKAIRKIIINK